VMHGRNPRTWSHDLRARIGEAADHAPFDCTVVPRQP
jgi:hypothetical protein